MFYGNIFCCDRYLASDSSDTRNARSLPKQCLWLSSFNQNLKVLANSPLLHLIKINLFFSYNSSFSHWWTWITEWRNQPTSRLYSIKPFLSTHHLYHDTRFVYQGDTFSALVFLKNYHDEKTVKVYVLHSDLSKKIRTLQLWKIINAGIYNWESRTEELYIGISLSRSCHILNAVYTSKELKRPTKSEKHNVWFNVSTMSFQK